MGTCMGTCLLVLCLGSPSLESPGLARYQTYLRGLERCTFDFEILTFFGDEESPLPNNAPRNILRGTVEYQQPYVHVIYTWKNEFINKKGKQVQNNSAGEIAITKDYWITLGGEGTDQLDGVTAKLGPFDRSSDYSKTLFISDFLLPISGVIRWNNFVPIAELLAQSSAITEHREEGNTTIKGRTPYGDINLVVDDAKHGAPQRLFVEKNSEALVAPDVRVRDIRHYDEVRINAITVSAEFSKYMRAGSLLIPEQIIISTTRKLVDGRVFLDRTECKLSNFKVVKAQPTFALSTKVPNSYPVTVVGQEQIDFVWMDGMIVKAIDQSIAADLRSQTFRSSDYYLSVFLIVASALLLALAGYLLVKRRAVAAGRAA
jgi:hypothetical protein